MDPEFSNYFSFSFRLTLYATTLKTIRSSFERKRFFFQNWLIFCPRIRFFWRIRILRVLIVKKTRELNSKSNSKKEHSLTLKFTTPKFFFIVLCTALLTLEVVTIPYWEKCEAKQLKHFTKSENKFNSNSKISF